MWVVVCFGGFVGEWCRVLAAGAGVMRLLLFSLLQPVVFLAAAPLLGGAVAPEGHGVL